MIAARVEQRIPIAAAHELDLLARRTAIIRYLLAGLLLLTVAAAISFGRNPERRAAPLFPGSDSGVLILDISASIGSPGRSFLEPLDYLARTGQDFGLVFFSDVAYEAVPVGTPAAELRPFIKIFTPPIRACAEPTGRPCPPGTRRMTKAEERFARRIARRPNPWSASFRGGTRISTGLRVGRQVLHREGAADRGALLVSDLDDSYFDLPAVTRELLAYKREGIPLKVVALGPTALDLRFFERLLGPEAFVPRANLSSRRPQSKATRTAQAFPVDLASVGFLALLLLGLNEHFCGRLSWRRRVGEGDEA